MRVGMRLTWVAGAVVIVWAATKTLPSVRAQQPPVFKAGVDLVTVDATVVDRDGRPIEGLQPADFSVNVDGRPRRIVTAQFTRFGQPPSGSHAVVPGQPSPADRREANVDATNPGRQIMLAFDHASFYATGTRSATVAARTFLATLGPEDRVGLVSYPQTGVFVAPTTDRSVISRELGQVMGTAVRPLPDGRPFVSLAESAAIHDGDRFTLDRVRARECAGYPPSMMQACVDHVQMVAREHVVETQEQTSQSLRALGDVLDRLARLPGRKAMVLVSGGLATGLSRTGESSSALLSQVASRAAAANVAIHVLHVDTGGLDAFDAERRNLSQTVVSDLGLQSAGLKDVAASTGGDVTTVVGQVDVAFDRIARILSAAYVLGIETESGDRDGRPHTIGVTVRRPGARVLSRRQFRITTTTVAPTAASSLADLVGDALRTGRVSADLPLRVAVFRMKDPETGRVRALVRADVGRGATAPATFTLGLAFVDASGRAVPADIVSQALPPGAGPDPCWVFQALVPLEPGAYTVRVAMADQSGTLGSTNVPFNAVLPRGAGASNSHLMLYDPARFGAAGPVPLIDGVVTGDEASAVFEVYPSDGAVVTLVEFSLAKAGGPPELTWPGRLTREAGGAVVAAEASVDVRDLQPGDYVLTATAMAEGRELARATGAIRIGCGRCKL